MVPPLLVLVPALLTLPRLLSVSLLLLLLLLIGVVVVMVVVVLVVGLAVETAEVVECISSLNGLGDEATPEDSSSPSSSTDCVDFSPFLCFGVLTAYVRDGTVELDAS